MEPTNKKQAEILNDIARGKYRDCYLVYNRKSTDDPDTQKNSIKYQKSENLRFAFREHLRLAPITLEGFVRDGVISERHSGFKERVGLTFGNDNTVQYHVGRPKFRRLAQMLSRRHFKGAIFLCWDRASRNEGDNTILKKLIKSGVDVRFTYANYDKTSAGALHMDIDGMFAEHHSRVTAEKVRLTIRDRRSKGLCTNKAPVGYLNPGGMEHKPFDPARAPIIKKLFAMAETGEWSLADLARWAIAQGFAMPPMRRRRTEEESLAEEEDDIRLNIEPVSRLPTANNIHKILTNPFYTGKVPGNDGVWVPTRSHKALISDDLYRRVQHQLSRRNLSARYADRIAYPLRGMVRCAACKRVYTPYEQKGIVYYGARCAPGCANPLKNFNFDFITEKIGKLIQDLSFTDEELAQLEAQSSTDIALLNTRRIDALENNERRKKRIREDLSYLHTNRPMLLRTGAYTPESLVVEERRLNGELASLQEEEAASDVSMQETVNDVVKLSELLKTVVPAYAEADSEEKVSYIRAIFSELFLSENTLDYKCRKGLRAFEARLVPDSDLIGWLSELSYQRDDMRDVTAQLHAVITA